MVRPELVDAYKRLDTRRELYKRATGLDNSIIGLGSLVFLLSIIPLIPIILERFLGFVFLHSLVGGILLGFSLMIIGQRIRRKNLTLVPSLSPNEEAFLDVFKTLENLDTYLGEEEIEFLRMKAKKSLLKFEKTLDEPSPSSTSEYLWKALTKDLNEQLRLLKQNINKMILPALSKGKKEDVDKVYPVIEKLALYLLNPNMSALTDLNESMSKLPSYVEEKVLLIPFLERHPRIRHAGIVLIFGLVGSAVCYIGIEFLNVSADNAYIAGTTLFGTLTAGYIAISFRKR